MSTNKQANRLIHEKSPYLLQHAYNPVDWFPWGEEAFEKAKSENKPIFLSIGYSTCHWCHVMEKESFEDPEVAEILNNNFVSIKVDREERPDIDHIYMDVCQALTGHGGWPLTIIMSPDQRPFLAGTYFPKNDRMGMNGLISILNAVVKAWKTKRNELINSGERITEYISAKHVPGRREIPEDIFDRAFSYYDQYFDEKYGGFGSAPKFPTPHNLMFLLRYWKMTGNGKALLSLIGLMYANSKGKDVVIAADDISEARPFIEEISLNFNPFTVWSLKKSDDNIIGRIAPFMENCTMLDGKATAYVCEGFSCNAPVTGLEEYKKLLHS